MFSVFFFRVLHLPFCKHEAWPAFKVLQKIGDKIRFSPDFAKNGGRLNENFSQDTIFLAKTLSLDLHTCSKLVTLWVNGIKPVHPVHQGSNKHTQP